MIYRLTILLFFVLAFDCAAQAGNDLFDDTYIHVIEINSVEPLSYSEFHNQLFDSHEPASSNHLIERANFPAVVTIDGAELDSVGVRYKGKSSFEFAYVFGKYPLKLDFNEFISGQEYDGLKKINLHNNLLDVSCMRSKLASEIMQRMGITATRVAYAKVYVNGSYRGLYSLVEQIDKTFVKSNFAPDTTGFLHKAYALSIGPVNVFPGQVTTDEGLAYSAPLKTKKSTGNYQPLRDYIIACNSATDLEFENDVNGIFDLESFIEQQAINMIISDYDHYCAANWNFYMYLDPVENKWYMLPWDYDIGFGTQEINIEDPANANWFNSDACFLNQRLLDIPSLKIRYHEALCEVIKYGMDSLWINNRINEIRDLIDMEVENDPFFWNVSDYNASLNQDHEISGTGSPFDFFSNRGIRDYINQKFEEVRQSLLGVGFNCDEFTTSAKTFFNDAEVRVYPNPVADFIRLENSSNDEIKNILIMNSLGHKVKSINNFDKSSQESCSIDLSNLPSGIYYLKLDGDFETNAIHRILKI